jgi:putative endopeptidase
MGTMDAALNFGGIGAVIGHELTHEFDDVGRMFDQLGNFRDWSTPADSKGFDQRAKCVADQYSQYTATGDLHINGNLTLSENLADAAGLRIAYMAMKEAEGQGQQETSTIDSFTPEQRFFLSYGLS